MPHLQRHLPALIAHRAALYPSLRLIVPQLKALRPHIGALLARMDVIGPYVQRLAPHLDLILPHTQLLLLQLDLIAPHLDELTSPPNLEILLPHLRDLAPHLAALAPHLPVLLEKLPVLQPVLPELVESLPVLLPHLGSLLERVDILAPKLPELLRNKELLLPNLHRLIPHLDLVSPTAVNGLAAVATAAGFLSTLRKKLFREEVVEPEVPLDLHKIETVLDATAARLIALESTLFAFKSDIQFRQQQQQEAAARLCMLEGMLFDSEDVFMEQTGRARELDVELSRVERLLGTEAIKRGRDRRMVEAKGRGAATPATYREGWDRWISKLPL